MSDYKYIDDESLRNIVRNRAATLEGQIAEARLTIRLLQDSGEDTDSEGLRNAIEGQERIVRMAQRHLANTDRYLKELDSTTQGEGTDA